MHALEQAILTTFKKTPAQAQSTTQLVQQTHQEEYENIERALKSQDPQERKDAKNKKARLHRKILYHLNKLVQEGLLKITGVQGRGEKRFRLAITGDVTITSGRKQVTIRAPNSIETPIDDITGATPYDQETWLQKINALLLEAPRHDNYTTLTQAIEEATPYVNDIIGVLRFDTLLGTGDPDELLERLKKMPCMISLIISLTRGEGEKAIRFCKAYANNKPQNVQIVFNISPRTLQEEREALTEIIREFMRRTIKINLKNSATHAPPIICGTAGSYTMSKESWRDYKTRRTSANGVAIGAGTIILDFEKITRAHEIARKAAQALFLAGRARDQERLARLREQGITLAYMDETIRCWNHELEKETIKEELKAAKEVAQEYAKAQERVYRACGLPTRCKIQLSSAIGKTPGLSPRTYQKVTVYNLATLQEEQYANYLEKRESLCRIFSSDRVRIFRHGEGAPEDILREAAFILNTYATPYITYDFSELQGELTLTEFFGGSR